MVKTCARCKFSIRQGMSLPLPGREPVVLCLSCLRDAVAAVLAHMDNITEQQALDILAGIGDGVALEQALQAAGLEASS